jgi:hypothetical protein
MPDQIQPTSEQHVSSLSPSSADAPNGTSGDWENEGGHMSSRFGRIVRDPTGQQAYKVILSHDQGAESERAFGTMRDAEAFVRRNTPRPKARSTFWDREAPQD